MEEKQSTNPSSPKEEIGKIIKEILALMGIDITPAYRETLNSTTNETDLVIVLNTEEHSQYLIGHHGANLYALEHIAHAITHQRGISARFRVDINDYREGKKMMFARMARDAAEDAVRTKKPVVLRAMNAYERRLVHTELSSNTQVSTESIGEGTDRKVVVKSESILASL